MQPRPWADTSRPWPSVRVSMSCASWIGEKGAGDCLRNQARGETRLDSRMTAPPSTAPIEVHRVSRLGAVNAYLVEEEDGFTLVDTMVSRSEGRLLSAAESLGRPIVRILLTHAHGARDRQSLAGAGPCPARARARQGRRGPGRGDGRGDRPRHLDHLAQRVGEPDAGPGTELDVPLPGEPLQDHEPVPPARGPRP